MPKVGFVSLGCPKNLVDSEIMLGTLAGQGYSITPRKEDADVIVVNTCGFIDSAKKESIDTILEMAELKTQRQLQETRRCRAASRNAIAPKSRRRFRKSTSSSVPTNSDGFSRPCSWTHRPQCRMSPLMRSTRRKKFPRFREFSRRLHTWRISRSPKAAITSAHSAQFRDSAAASEAGLSRILSPNRDGLPSKACASS